MKQRAPIVLFVYNRPWHAKQTLESLAANEGAEKSELFVFCDGPKKSRDKEAVEEVRAIVRSRQWCGIVHVIEQDKNIGLADSIISGVTEIVKTCGQVIVLEDDLLLSEQFLNYMNDALEIYSDEPRIMHISGYMYPVDDELPETFLYRNPSSWGWATWKRAWEKFEPDASKLLKNFDNDKQQKFDIEGNMWFYEMLKNQSKGKIDSWAIRWYASIFLNEGLCLYPGKSRVNNIGHDLSGRHCGYTNIFDVAVSQKRIVDFTKAIKESNNALRAMAAFYRNNVTSVQARVVNFLRHLWHKFARDGFDG